MCLCDFGEKDENHKDENDVREIEVDSATPDFERASRIFTEAHGLRIDEECVRMLYATCFVPRQSRQADREITGRELVVQNNPAEISDMTEPVQENGHVTERNNEVLQTENESERRGNQNTTEKNDKRSTSDAVERNCPVPLGVVDTIDDAPNDAANEEDVSVSFVESQSLSVVLFEEQHSNPVLADESETRETTREEMENGMPDCPAQQSKESTNGALRASNVVDRLSTGKETLDPSRQNHRTRELEESSIAALRTTNPNDALIANENDALIANERPDVSHNILDKPSIPSQSAGAQIVDDDIDMQRDSSQRSDGISESVEEESSNTALLLKTQKSTITTEIVEVEKEKDTLTGKPDNISVGENKQV